MNVHSYMKKALKELLSSYAKWVLLILIIIYMCTGIYKIEQDEIGIAIRCGKIIDNNVTPGLHYRIPWPIDSIIKVAVKQMMTLVIDDFTSDNWQKNDRVRKFVKYSGLEPSCISGDNNIVSISILIKYNVINPVHYIFNIKSNKKLMQSISASTVVKSLAKISVDEILTFGKKNIENEIKSNLQRQLNELNAGIGLSFIEIKKIEPPNKIRSYFEKVINAKVQSKKAIHNAQAYKNSLVPEARSDADKIIREAESYKKEKILMAEGDAAGFLSRLDEYKKAKNINRKKIYIDCIKEVFQNLKEIRVVGKNKNHVLKKYMFE